ncbi:MAG: alpha/beta hydrolase [Rhodoferax sp.]|nr:alpha/beta hydrolase [Rhodoferax sp.]
MYINVHGSPQYAYTGGRPYDASRPTIVFIHGVLNDHSVWILQSRYLAHHGWNVLALDLPGHCRSGGEPPGSVEQAAQGVLALLDALGLQRAVLAGHSFGSLVALEAAGQAPERVPQLVLVGTAAPMRVSDALLQASQDEPMRALEMVNQFSRSTLAPPPSALGPGTWVYGASMALGRRVLASNPRVNLFHTGFLACDRYRGAEAAMERVSCPVLFLLGSQDQMTPPRAAQPLVQRARQGQVVLLPGGHHQMTETPEPLLAALKGFLARY